MSKIKVIEFLDKYPFLYYVFHVAIKVFENKIDNSKVGKLLKVEAAKVEPLKTDK